MPAAIPPAFFAAGSIYSLLPSGGTANKVPCVNSGGTAWSWRTVLDSAATQTANQFYAGPSSGSAAAPSFRVIGTADLGTGTADNTTYLRGDGTWATVSLSSYLPLGGGTLSGRLATTFAGHASDAALGSMFFSKLAAVPATNNDFLRLEPNGSTAALFNVDKTGFISSRAGLSTISSPIQSGTFILAAVGNDIGWSGGARLNSGAAGQLQLGRSATMIIQIGDTTSSFPALKRSGTAVEVKVADDSAYAQIRAASIGVGNSATASVGVGTIAKKIEVFDAAGASLGFIPVYATIT